MGDILFAAGKIIIDAQHIMAIIQKPFTEMRAQKSRTAGDQYFLRCHINFSFRKYPKKINVAILAPIRKQFCTYLYDKTDLLGYDVK